MCDESLDEGFSMPENGAAKEDRHKIFANLTMQNAVQGVGLILLISSLYWANHASVAALDVEEQATNKRVDDVVADQKTFRETLNRIDMRVGILMDRSNPKRTGE